MSSNDLSDRSLAGKLKSTGFVFDSIWYTLALIPAIAIPIALIIVGAQNLNNCPIERYIPIWMIVFGSVVLFAIFLKFLVNICLLIKKRSDSDASLGVFGVIYSIFNLILGLFLFAWFIAGNVWVFRNASTVDIRATNFGAANYCDRSCYMFPYAYIIISWGFVFLGCCCACFLGVCAVAGVGIGSWTVNRNAV